MKSFISKIVSLVRPKDRVERVLKKKWHPADRWLLLATAALSLFGILMVYDSSVVIALRDFGNPYYYAREQLRWLILGAIALFIFSRLDYHILHKFSLPFLITTLILLIGVFVPGIGVHALGARRWLNFGLFILQPAELAKLSLIIYLSAWFAHREKGRFGAFLLLVSMVLGLVILEPDLGTAIIILIIALVLYFFSGAPIVQFVLLVPVLLVSLSGLALAAPYRFRRLTTFFNPNSDPLGASYQIRQVLLALGSGGWFGVGIGKSRQKYEYLPEANTDSIFAIIGEEVGFIGAMVIIALFLFLLWRGFRIASRAPDMFGKLLALGISSWIGIQTIINLAAMVALLPLTGVPLPLISYGGSSLIILLAALGILLNISKQRTSV